MGKRSRLEQKLLRAAAKGSLKRVSRLFPEQDDDDVAGHYRISKQDTDGSISASGIEDTDHSHKCRKDELTRKKRKVSRQLDEHEIFAEKVLFESESNRHRRKQSTSAHGKDRKKHLKKIRQRHRKLRELDINCQDLDGWTPLHHAAFAGAKDVVQVLVSHGADVSSRDKNGRIAAHVAAKQGHIALVSFLAESGANLMQADHFGVTVSSILSGRLESLREKILRNAAAPEGADVTEQRDWPEQLWGNLSDDEGHNWATWDGNQGSGAWGSGLRDEADEVGLDEDSWRDEIAKAMERKRREREEASRKEAAAAAEASWGHRVKGPWGTRNDKERQEAEEVRRKESQRILEEEQAKDKAWREQLQDKMVSQQQTRYLENWARFAGTCNVGLGLADVPFPVELGKEADLRKVLLLGVAAAGHRKRIREEILKWHPDKFFQKWGKQLRPSEKELVLVRVKEISQQVQEVYASLPKEAS